MSFELALSEARQFALDAVYAGGLETLRYFRQHMDVRNKKSGEGFDPVTTADRACERTIRQRIRTCYPDHGIQGEEFGEQSLGEWYWVIDPIDGTRGFISGFAHWGVLLGLVHHQEPVLGVLHQPYLGEYFVGEGQNAQFIADGVFQSLKTSEIVDLTDVRFATTHPGLFKTPIERAFLNCVESRVRLSRYGNDCYQYAMLAQGSIDLVIENQLNPWDIIPLAPIVRGAGGILTNWLGEDDLSSGFVIAAANAGLHAQVMELLQGENPS